MGDWVYLLCLMPGKLIRVVVKDKVIGRTGNHIAWRPDPRQSTLSTKLSHDISGYANVLTRSKIDSMKNYHVII